MSTDNVTPINRDTGLIMVSSDGHAAPQYMADYLPYLDKPFRDDFADVCKEHDRRLAQNRITPSSDLYDVEMVERHRRTVEDPLSYRGEWDASFRAKQALETQGCVAEVLFHQSLLWPFSPGMISSGVGHRDWTPAHFVAGATAYNRWLADFVSPEPDRYAAQAIVFFYDVDQAIAEVRWAKEQGFRGIIAPGCDPTLPFHWHPRYEPFWQVCEELDMPLNFHVGTGESPGDRSPEIPMNLRSQLVEIECGVAPRRHLPYMIMSGVLERFPKLKLVFTEIRADWVPQQLSLMDWVWEHGRTHRSSLPNPPSFYWNRQCYVGASLVSRGEVHHHAEIGHLMFGIDYPHLEGCAADVLNYLRAVLADGNMTDGQVKAFLGETAIDVFNFDRAKLAPLAAKQGYTMKQLREAIPSTNLPDVLQRTDVNRTWNLEKFAS